MGIRGWQTCGPHDPVAIHPYSLHPRGARPNHIRVGFITYKQYFRGRERQRFGKPNVDTWIWFRATKHAGVQTHFEVMRETDALQVGVSIAQRRQSITALQHFEGVQDFRERFHLIARSVPLGERVVSDVPIVAHGLGAARERFTSQIRQVVGTMRLLFEQRRAQREDLRGSEAFRYPRVSRTEPIGENPLRARKHRLDGPESVVEIETDRADGAEFHGANFNEGRTVRELLLTIGNKNYSSWSLRPWILMKHLGLPFTERMLPLDTPEFARDVAAVSPTRRVPVLKAGDLTIWDSLAICEYACELAGSGWPLDREARAVARAFPRIPHAGFSNLRSQWPMNARALGRHTAPSPERAADIARIEDSWEDCRTRFGGSGPWLFGDYSVADAMYAPVVLRFRTYGARVRESSARYIDTVLADAPMREWLAAAAAERWTLEASEVGR